MNELAEAREMFKRKIKRAFARADSNNSGTLEEEGLRLVLKICSRRIDNADTWRIFGYLDRESSGFVKLHDLEEFLLKPPGPRQIIHLLMADNLFQPDRFLEYRTWEVKSRPLDFRLGPGRNNIAAFFDDSSNLKMATLLRKGAKLAFINTVRVDNLGYYDIMDALSCISCPFSLTFFTQDIWDGAEGSNGELKFSKDLPDSLNVKEEELVHRPYLSLRSPELVKKIYLESFSSPHCEHCPLDDSWFAYVHRFMEDETFSEGSFWLSYAIMLLIGLSTLAYILQTVPSYEDWWGWQRIEGVLSILFSIEFGVRLIVCRNMFHYMADPWNIIDFCAVAPFWIEIVSWGALDASTLRIVRSVRLFRILRLSKTGSFGEAIDICKTTISSSIHWMIVLCWLAVLIIIVFGSFAWIIEKGEWEIYTECEVMSQNLTCFSESVSSLLQSNLNIVSSQACELECEVGVEGGCCCFDQITGYCEFWSNPSLQNVNDLSLSASLCNVYELSLRPSEDTASPFVSMIEGMWWICVTLTMVGYGDYSATTIPGKFVALVCTQIGIFFVACPIIVVGFHFTVALFRLQIKKVIFVFKSQGKATVNCLLELANAVVEMELFDDEDELVMLSNRINSEEKLKQLLSLNTGWNYLPHAEEEKPGLPRTSQFKLFVLYTIFGRSFQRNKKAMFKRGIKFEKDLDLIMPKFGSTMSVLDMNVSRQNLLTLGSNYPNTPRSSSGLQRLQSSPRSTYSTSSRPQSASSRNLPLAGKYLFPGKSSSLSSRKLRSQSNPFAK